MSEIVTEPVIETPAAPETPVVKTDEPLGEPGLAALKAEREARAAVEKRLKEFEDRDKSEAEKLTERLTAAEKRAAELEAKNIRAEIAADKGIPLDVLNRLTGSTKDELEASADALIAYRGQQQTSGLHVPNEGKSPNAQKGHSAWSEVLSAIDRA